MDGTQPWTCQTSHLKSPFTWTSVHFESLCHFFSMLCKPGYEAWLDPKDTVWMGPNLELTRHYIWSPLSLGLQFTLNLCHFFSMLCKPGYEAWLDPKDTVWMGPNLELTRHHIWSPLSLGHQFTLNLCQIFMSCFLQETDFLWEISCCLCCLGGKN